MDIRHEKSYTTTSGNRFARFFTPEGGGRIAEVKVREGRDGLTIWSISESRAFAFVHFAGLCAGKGKCPVTVH